MKTAEIIAIISSVGIVLASITHLILVLRELKKRGQQLSNTESMIKNIKLKDNGTDVDKLVDILKEE